MPDSAIRCQARCRIEIDGYLDRLKKLRSQLYLVDDHEAVMFDEPGGVVLRSAQRCWIVEEADHCRLPVGGQPGRCAFASLASAVDEDDARVLKCLVNQGFSAARNQARRLGHVGSVPYKQDQAYRIRGEQPLGLAGPGFPKGCDGKRQEPFAEVDAASLARMQNDALTELVTDLVA